MAALEQGFWDRKVMVPAPDGSKCWGVSCDQQADCVLSGCCLYKPSRDENKPPPPAEPEPGPKELPLHALTILAPRPVEEETVLEEAQRITGDGGERNDSYNHPRHNFSGIAAVWNGILHEKLQSPITPAEVALLMIGMKCVREAHKGKRDNLVDIAGYARCIERLSEVEC